MGRVYHGCARLLAALAAAALGSAAELPPGALPRGSTFLIVQAHHDDHTWEWGFGGFAARLVDSGWSGWFVRTTNDEKDGPPTWGRNDQVNLKESQDAARHLGLKGVISLNWRNDHMDSLPLQEVRAQFILLIRRYRPDAVMTFDPWGHYDRNPDHRKVARAAAEAVWMAGFDNVHPEHETAGLKSHRVPFVYFGQRMDYGRGHTPNIAIEINAEQVRRKGEAYWAHRNVRNSPGLARSIRSKLADRGLAIPEWEKLTDEQAVEQLHKWHMEWSSRQNGKRAGLPYAEVFFFRDEWDHMPGLVEYLKAEVKPK